MNAPFSIAQAAGSVATDFSAQSKPPRVIKVEKPQSNQAITIHLDGNTKLDLSGISNDKITFVRVGERLVILFDNQATVTVEPIFASDGSTSADVTFQVDLNRLMTGTEFAAAFPIGTDQSILPAAGDGAGGPAAGAHFSDASVDPLGPVALNALLGPEELGGPAFGPRDVGSVAGFTIGTADGALLDEEGLAGGNAGGPGDVAGQATSFTGSLHVDFGQDSAGRSFQFTATQPGLGGLTSGGQEVHIALGTIGGAPALFGYIGNDPTLASARVFVVTLDNGPIDGAYTVTILKPLDHPTVGTEDDLTLSIGFTAIGGSGNSGDSTISITINDDSPTAAAIADHTALELTAAPGGDFVAQSTGAVSLDIGWGADNANTNAGAIDRKVAFLTTDAPAGLTSNGEAITYSLNADGTVLTASAGARTVFTVTLSDTDNGSYTFTLLDNLDHATGNGANDLPLSFAVRATDADGDPVDTGFAIHVTDDVPTVAAIEDQTVIETLVPLDSDPTGDFVPQTTGAVSLNIHWGADDDNTPDALGIDRTVAFGSNTIASFNALGLTSDGQTITYALSDSDTLLTASVGTRVIFTVQLSDAANGSYTFNLLDNLDHPTGQGQNDIALSFAVRATDADGDPVDTGFTVHVTDDVPTVNSSEGIQLFVAENTQSGDSNAFIPHTTDPVALNINWGADDANPNTGPIDRKLSLTDLPAGLTSGGVAITYAFDTDTNLLTASAGEHVIFKLQLSDEGNGSYVFTLLGPLDHPIVPPPEGEGEPEDTSHNDLPLTFGIIATDADGDPVSVGSFTVHIIDDVPTAGPIDSQSLFEQTSDTASNAFTPSSLTGISLNIDWNSDDDNTPDLNGIDRTVAFSANTVGNFDALHLTSNGETITYALSDNDTLLTASVGDRPVFTVQLSDLANGSYTFNLLDNLDHVFGEGDVLPLLFNVVATDADGDPVNTSFIVNVNDDVAQITAAADQLKLDEEGLAGNAGDSYLNGTDQPGTLTSGSGNLHIDWNSDDANPGLNTIDRSVAFDGIVNGGQATYGAGSPLSSSGDPVKLWLVGATLYGYTGADPADDATAPDVSQQVFTVTLSDVGTGSYTFTLLQNLDHPIKGAEDDITLTFGFKVTDADGDVVPGAHTFDVVVNDDAPVLTATSLSFTADEGDILTLLSAGSSPDDGNADGSYTGSPADIIGPAYVSGSIAAAVSFGADGGGAKFGFTGDVLTAMADLGLTSKGAALSFVLVGNTLVGYVNVFAGGYQPLLDRTVFTLELQNNGSFKFNEYDQLDHVAGDGKNTELLTTHGQTHGSLDAIDFGAVVKATDGDGDSIALTGAFKIEITDDVPAVSIVATGHATTIDETPGLQNDDTNSNGVKSLFAAFESGNTIGTDPDVTMPIYARDGASIVLAASLLGADEPRPVALSLRLSGTVDPVAGGVDSGLTTTAGKAIYLFEVNGQIIGKYDADGNGSAETAAFAVNLDQAGRVSIAQYVSLHHPIAPNDYDDTVDLGDKVLAVATATDFDGDKAESTVAIGHQIRFDDDGPSFTAVVAPTLVIDGNLAGGPGDYPNPGNWSPNGAYDSNGNIVGWQYAAAPVGGAATVQLERVDSGYHGVTSSDGSALVDLEATPGNIQVTQILHNLTAGQGLVVSFEIGQADFGNAKLDVLWNGVSVGTFDPLAGVPAQLHSVSVTALAGDNVLTFREIGTSGDNTGTFLTNVAVHDAIIIDETPGVDANSNDTLDLGVAALFEHVVNPGSDAAMGSPQFAHGAVSLVSVTPNFGADGPGPNPIAYALTISQDGVDSGLTTTDNKAIQLFSEDNGHLIVGRYETDGVPGITESDTAAFALTIDAVTGQVSIAQYVSLHHPDTNSHDEGIYLAAGSLFATVTVTDGDLDTATQSFDVTSNIRFEDDGPTVGASPLTFTGDEDQVIVGSVSGHDAAGADGLATTNPYDVVTGVIHGTLNFDQATGTFTYTPDANYNGVDHFTYTIMDGDGDVSTPVTVTLNVNPVPEPPIAIDSVVVVATSWFGGGTADMSLSAMGVGPLTYTITDPFDTTAFGPLDPVNPATGALSFTVGDSAAGTTDQFGFTVSNAYGSDTGVVTFSRISGTASYNLTGTDGNDVFLLSGRGGELHAGGGNDSVREFLRDGSTTTVYGDDGNDEIEIYSLPGSSVGGTMHGGAGDDILAGGLRADTLDGGTGNDTLIGGSGSDIFVYAETGAANRDIITDYKGTEGDVLDLSALLDAAFTAGDPVDHFVRAVTSGGDAVVQVNLDGNGNDWEDVAVLQGYGSAANEVLVKLEAAAAAQAIHPA